MNKRQIGSIGEDMAVEFLKSRGVKILERNYQNRFGEIDIIGREDNTLLFIEVKYRKNESFGYPLEAVGFAKREKIRKMARFFLNENHYYHYNIRFDCIGIIGLQIEWIKGAFY
ncbi:YraN family protein [Lachnoanaerobaculum saburreum]|uniref:YraN family protein n=1 Tax=Lachnoanaerobaculum saburreum TaxID=467210 RepID=UPI00054DEEEC|nr:YraN family protein [Lachnoanaerobaculum saburreum]